MSQTVPSNPWEDVDIGNRVSVAIANLLTLASFLLFWIGGVGGILWTIWSSVYGNNQQRRPSQILFWAIMSLGGWTLIGAIGYHLGVMDTPLQIPGVFQ
ncbi:MAG: hypothetical protein N2505_00270 [Endomicrobia bacterium]|nr:hypothetical protein [Endomicrobiia bacterium]